MAGAKEDDEEEVQTGKCPSGQFKKKKKNSVRLYQRIKDKALTTQSVKI